MWNTFRIPYQISYDCDRKYGYKEPVHTDYFNSVKFLTFIFTFALYLYTTIPNSQVPTSVKLPFNVILSHIYIYHLENIIIYVNFNLSLIINNMLLKQVHLFIIFDSRYFRK